ncbi:hypothetical protein WN944_013432 [Citrus x changshan-huyou]|uniref:Uncharacterized protein n=1 Tax=Citrus x changshan-huyou TaxID=2935761 RepID=A0AAP0M3W5_9ROSI
MYRARFCAGIKRYITRVKKKNQRSVRMGSGGLPVVHGQRLLPRKQKPRNPSLVKVSVYYHGNDPMIIP